MKALAFAMLLMGAAAAAAGILAIWFLVQPLTDPAGAGIGSLAGLAVVFLALAFTVTWRR